MKGDQLLAALAELRDALVADGADLDVVDFDGATAHFRLLLGPDTCQDCVMPKDFLEQVMLAKLRQSLPELAHVELDDPRTE